MGKIDIKSMRLDELQAAFLERGLPKYRAAQVYRWLQQRGAVSFDEMTDLSKELRAALPETFEIRNTEIVLRRVSKLDGTVKYLFRLHDGETIESVLMQYHHGYSICISTQVGCKMGCSFCATGKSGFSRDLTPSEMLSEIQTAQRDVGVRISNVVLMGMGEPLDNYQNVLRFLELVSSENGLNIGMRHISLSTCG
ncbi:MAG: radical SAM protein, partial [Hominenteromicrobium sp.]